MQEYYDLEYRKPTLLRQALRWIFDNLFWLTIWIAALGLGLLVYFDEPKPFTGYIVCKEYAPGGMCHSKPPIQQEASLLGYVHVVTTSRHTHQYEKPTWQIWVANKESTRSTYVTAAHYRELYCGQKYTIQP